MKRKEIMYLLLVGVVAMMLTACASSRRVVNMAHAETKDSVATSNKDSVRKVSVASDSLAKVSTSEEHSSGITSDNGNFEETITEHITETVDSLGNKTTTTDRTTRRKGRYQKQEMRDSWQQQQQQEIGQKTKSVDSLAVSTKSDVGTHWAVQDSISDEQEKNTDDVKKTSFLSKARKNAFQLVLLMIVFIMLLTLKRKRDEKSKRSGNESSDNK